MSWSPAETWLFVAFVLLAVVFIVRAGWTAHQDRRDRPSRLTDMTADEAHMADLRRLQKQLHADYGVPDPTPVDPSGRVHKVGTDFDRGGAA